MCIRDRINRPFHHGIVEIARKSAGPRRDWQVVPVCYEVRRLKRHCLGESRVVITHIQPERQMVCYPNLRLKIESLAFCRSEVGHYIEPASRQVHTLLNIRPIDSENARGDLQFVPE